MLVIGLFLVSLLEPAPDQEAGGLALPTFLVVPMLGIAGANTLTRMVRQRATRLRKVRSAVCKRYDLANCVLGSLTAMLVALAALLLLDGWCVRLWGVYHPVYWLRELAGPLSIAVCAGYATWRFRQRTWIVGPAATTVWLSAILLWMSLTAQGLGMRPSEPLLAVLATVVGTGVALVIRYGWRIRPTG